MTLALATDIGSLEATREAPRPRLRAAGRAARGVAGAFALVLGSAVLLSATATASPACSGSVLVADAVVLPDLSRTT